MEDDCYSEAVRDINRSLNAIDGSLDGISAHLDRMPSKRFMTVTFLLGGAIAGVAFALIAAFVQ